MLSFANNFHSACLFWSSGVDFGLRCFYRIHSLFENLRSTSSQQYIDDNKCIGAINVNTISQIVLISTLSGNVETFYLENVLDFYFITDCDDLKNILFTFGKLKRLQICCWTKTYEFLSKILRLSGSVCFRFRCI